MRIVLIVMTLLGAYAQTSAAEPAKLNEEARVFYERGLKLYAEQKYSAASKQFSRAYDIDAHPNVIYTWAQAERLDGHCARASRLYREYMEFDLSVAQASAAEANLIRCDEILEEFDRLDRGGESDTSNEGGGADEGGSGAGEAGHGGSGEDQGEKGETELLIGDQPPEIHPWYTDLVTLSLLGGALAGAGVGIWAYNSALDIEDRALDEPDDVVYERLRSQSASRRTTAAVAAGLGGVALIVAFVRIGLADDPDDNNRKLQVWRSGSATGLGVSGRF